MRWFCKAVGTGLIAAVILAGLRPSPAATYNVTVPPRADDAYEQAHYRLWMADGVPALRGVIVRQHGCGPGARKLGLEHADDIQWQALAAKWDCALLGTQLWAPQEDCTTWTMPDDGSAHAFLTALEELARQSGHPELKTVPWALWGHSGGAVWVLNMAYKHPERVLAVFARSGGLGATGRQYPRSRPPAPDSSPAAFDVPVLFCYGAKEHVEESRFYNGVAAALAVYETGRRHGAVWAVAAHPDSDHENGNSRLLAIRFFEAVFQRRLPAPTTAASSAVELPRLDRQLGWLADPASGNIEPSAVFQGRLVERSWLVDEATARAWQQFVASGTISDTTPPPAPHDVRIRRAENGALLTWSAVADIDSGIREFRIYRDGQQIGTVGGERIERWNPEGHFHAWNYSDQPLPESGLPAMRLLDRAAPRQAGAEYRVTTVNQAGLESPFSAAAVLQ